MRIVKLEILAEDMKENNYAYSLLCPITKALRRKGYNLRSVGKNIRNGDNSMEIIPSSNHAELDQIVCRTEFRYMSKEGVPQDFEFDLILDSFPPSENLPEISNIV